MLVAPTTPAPHPHPLVRLWPQSIIFGYHSRCRSHSHSHSHSLFELKLNSSSDRVLALVRAGPDFQASASPSQLFDDHHTASPSPPSNKDDAGIETKGIAASFGKLKAHKLKLLARKAKQQLTKHQHFRDTLVVTEEAEAEAQAEREKETTRRASNLPVKRVNKTSSHEIKPPKSDSKMAGSHVLVPRPSSSSYSRRSSSSHSRGWGKGVDSRSTQVSVERGHENDFFSRKSFRDLGCTDFMIESLKGQVFVRPSHIQAKAFAPVIDGKSCVIADQSGSGKTLAYLIPLIQRLRLEELQGLGQSSSQSPRVLILVPTAELASQAAVRVAVGGNRTSFPYITYSSAILLDLAVKGIGIALVHDYATVESVEFAPIVDNSKAA
ncbi:unnamed protein product [Dovyalis caffra]|uniref:Helicase ATP-binding domain-containing protein n=1 Tax=Dovyalis caffra TaxID=77055 RepID=A0AAV1R0M8_9ROSI|nr:unnamed protein product [Dovyalis caffra]